MTRLLERQMITAIELSITDVSILLPDSQHVLLVFSNIYLPLYPLLYMASQHEWLQLYSALSTNHHRC